MVEAATEFRKNGFNDSDAATLAKTATMFQNVSDEAISAGDSASFIISQMIAFGIEAENAQSIIDKVNETANKFSVSSGDLSKALGIVASTSSAMGNSIDQTLGVVTAITEQTRNASKSARAANTIFSRLAQVVDENSDTGKKLTEIYNNLGIALYDSSGQMRSTYDILADLASKWDSLDKNTQQYIAITSAGTNQLNNFLALMNNFDHAAEATATSINSAGSAMRENEAFQESLEYQTNNLKATFQDLANNVIDKELISSVLKLGDAFLKLANTDIGQFVSKVTLLGGTAWGVESLIHVSKILPTVITQFKNFGAVLSLVAKGSGTFGAAISAAGGFASVALPTFLAVSAALIGIIEAVKYISTADTRKLESLSSSLQETNDKIAEMTATGSEYETLIQNTENLTEVEKTRLGILQAQLDTLQAQSKEQENAYLTEWQRQQKETRHDWIMGEGTTETGETYTGYVWGEYTQETQATEDLISAVSRLTQAKYSASITDAEYISGLQNELDAHKEQYNNLIKLNELYEETGNDTLKLTDAQEEFIKVYEYQSSIVSDLGNQYANMSNDIGAFGNAAEESASKLDTYIAALEQYRGANKKAAGASGVLVNSLFDANGQLTEAAKQALSTSGSMASMAQSFIQAQQAQAQADFSALILAIQEVGNAAMITTSQLASMMAMAGVSTASDLVGGRAAGTTSDMEGLRQAYFRTFGKSADADTAGFNKWVTSQIQSAGQSNYQKKMEEYKKQLKSIKPYVPSGGGSSSTKKDQKEVKAQTINTIEELRDYLTDESTRLKLIDPDISKSDLRSTLSEVATVYQSYQNYLSQLKQQGFDETSQQYKQAEAEFAQFVEVLKTLFSEIVSKGTYSVDELVTYIEKNCGDLSGSISGLLDGLKDKVSSTVSSVTGSIHQAFASGNANSAIAGIEKAWAMIRQMGASIEETYDTAVAKAVENASAEKGISEEVAEEYDRQNQLLEDKIALEEKLEALEKAKQRRMLVYSEGRFQYMQDADAISSAQADYQETYRGIEQSQKKDLLGMLGDKSSEIFKKYFSESKTYQDVMSYPEYLRNQLMSYLGENIAGTIYEGMSADELYSAFGSAMKPGEAYKMVKQAAIEAEEAREQRRQREAELKKQIREENVKSYGVNTDFGKKILESQSQEEAAYWAKLRDTKIDMMKEYRDVYGDEAAKKYFGVSDLDSIKSTKDVYKEAWSTGNLSYSASDWERQHMFDNDEQYRYTVEDPNLTAAQYNVAAGLSFDGYKKADQALFNRIFSGSITKSELQDIYNDKSLSDVTKGYVLNLASEMKNAGYPGYARGTRHANRGLSLVGENGPELRVLNHGDGILPSGITDNLWRWGSMTPRDMLDSLAQKAQSWAQTLNISNVTLPNVRDAQSFVSGLRELAQQYVTRRS